MDPVDPCAYTGAARANFKGGEHFFFNPKNGGPGGGSPLVGVWRRSPQKNLKIAFLKPSKKFDFWLKMPNLGVWNRDRPSAVFWSSRVRVRVGRCRVRVSSSSGSLVEFEFEFEFEYRKNYQKLRPFAVEKIYSLWNQTHKTSETSWSSLGSTLKFRLSIKMASSSSSSEESSSWLAVSNCSSYSSSGWFSSIFS